MSAANSARKIALFVCALLVSSSLFALDVPPAPDRWFTDGAGMIGAAEADALNSKLSDFEKQSGAQFIIYTFPSLESEAIEDFTIRCAEKWKVGQKKYDNGLILFVFAKERKVRIETGYGLEGTMTDAFSSRVIREFLGPPFQRGQYAEGLNAAADAIIQRIRTGEAPVAPLQRRGGGGDPSIFTVLIILFVVFFVIVPMLMRSRRAGCGGCMLPLFLSGGGTTFGSSGGFGGGFGGGGGGFSGGGGGFGGGGATGGW